MKRRFALLGLLALLPATGVLAQKYPDRPIRLIAAQSAGSSLDTITRIVTPKVSERLGQQIVIDNRGGAAGIIGLEIGARATANGYALIVGASSSMMKTVLAQPDVRQQSTRAPFQFLSSLKLMVQCVPSQNGLFFDPPHRQSA